MTAFKRAILFTLVILMLVSLSGWLIKTIQAQVQFTGTDDKRDMRSALNAADTAELLADSGGITGIGMPPRVGPNIQVNAVQQGFPNGLFGRSETTIAASDPLLNGLLVVGFNDAQGFCGSPFGVACTPQSPPGLSGYAFSTNGGATWTDGGAPDPAVFGNVFTRGDPWLDRGGFDNLTIYFANLSVDATTGADLGVSVHRGHFSGSTFAWQDVRVFNAPNAPNDFYDKEAIATAKDGSGAGYASVTNFIGLCGQPAFGFGQIEVWRTHDAGDTWVGPVIVSPDVTFITDPTNANCGFTGISQQSSVPAIGPKGEVYVAWQFGPTFNPGASTDAAINVAASFDGGVTFGTPVTVANINSLRGAVPVGYNRDRINDHPRVSVATTGPFKGRVYVTYASAVAPTPAGAITACPAPNVGQTCRAQRLTSIQVFVAFSDDQGQTWTSVPVAPAPPATGLKRWWPVVTAESGGNLDVIYYESVEAPVSSGAVCNVSVGGAANRRRGTAHSLVDTFWAQSTDGGATFKTPIKVTNTTSDWCTTVSNVRPNFGDYIGSFSGGNHVFPVWGDGRNGVPDTFYSTGLGAGKTK
jgi:hypothetical protein